MRWLLAAYKFVASFRKSEWQLEDYPVRLVQQVDEGGTPAAPAWRAQVIGWGLAGLGSTADEALRDLRSNLETRRAQKRLPRPGTRPLLEYAASTELDRHGEFAYDFVERVVGIRPLLMSDGTYLDEFCGQVELAEVHRKIALLYGVDMTEWDQEPLWKVLDRIHPPSGAA